MRIIEIAVDQSLIQLLRVFVHTNCFVFKVVERAINVLKQTAREDLRIVISVELVKEKNPYVAAKGAEKVRLI